MPRLLRAVLQNKSMGRAWCGHARPTTTLGSGKILVRLPSEGGGQILPLCSKKEQKIKRCQVEEIDYSLNLLVDYDFFFIVDFEISKHCWGMFS